MRQIARTQFTVRRLFGVITIVAILLGVIAYFRTEPYCIRRIRALEGERLRGIGGSVDWHYTADVADWAEACGLIRLRTITGITVDNDDFTNDDLRRLVSCASLRDMTISSRQVTDEGIAAIAEMPEINALRIDCIQVSDRGLERLANLAHLRDLEVKGSSKVTGAFLERFSEEKPLGEWQGLQTGGPRSMSSLKLHGEGIDDRVCQWLVKFQKIRFLDLGDTHITDNGLLTLQSAKRLEMEVLIVRRTLVSKAGVESFAAARPDTAIIPRFRFPKG